MAKKLVVGLAILLCLAASGYGYVLLDSEDFESYTAFSAGNSTESANFIVNESLGVWNCTSDTLGTYPLCTALTGSGAGKGAGYSMISSGANKYLEIYALNGTFSDYYVAGLKYDHTNITAPSADTLSLRLQMRNAEFSNTVGGGGLVNTIAGAYFNVLASAPYTSSGILLGGQASTNETNFTSLRAAYQSGVATAPASSTCTMNDHAWHYITEYLYFNSTCDLQSIAIYKDGAFCYNFTYLKNYACGDSIISSDTISFYSQREFRMYYDNITWANGTAPTSPDIYECSDSIDNDGDGFTDYPSEPQCTSATDNSEVPYEYTQCNNGVDDDFDGNTDLADPDCIGLADTSEFGNSTTSPIANATCTAAELCLLNEPFVYNDDISKYGWEGNISNNQIASFQGSNKLLIQPDNSAGFNTWHNISNPNIYNNVLVEWQVFGNYENVMLIPQNYTYYVKIRDDQFRTAVWLRFVTVQAFPNNKQNVYINDGGSWEFVGEMTTSLLTGRKTDFSMVIDQINKQVTSIVWTDSTGMYGYSTTYGYYDTSAGKAHSFGLESAFGQFDGNEYLMYMDLIAITGNDVYYDTVCDEYTPPYFLKESFNGYLYVCNWDTSHRSIHNLGKLSLDTDMSLWSAERRTDESLDSDKTNYVTMAWDFKPIDYNGLVGQFVVRSYDALGNNIITIYTIDDKVYYASASQNKFVSGFFPPLNVSHRYMVVMNLPDGAFDLYINGTKYLNGVTQAKESLGAISSIDTLKLESYAIKYELDNVSIYTSDENGVPLLPVQKPKSELDNATKFCGLFYTHTPTCTVDADCLSGQCNPTGKCNAFDMNYCDDNDMERSNKCYMAGIASCAMNSTANVILDNFLLVLVGILLLVGAVYVSIMFRRRE